MCDKSKKLTVFVRVKVENEQDILIGLNGEQPQEVLDEFTKGLAYALTADSEVGLLKVHHCERTQLSLFKPERHLFTGTIYLNPNKVVMAFIDADDVPVASIDEEVDFYVALARACASEEDKENEQQMAF